MFARMGTGISRMRAITKAAGVSKPKFNSNLFFTIKAGHWEVNKQVREIIQK